MESTCFRSEPSLPYNPLPRVAYETARSSILSLGFDASAILHDYSYCGRDGQHLKINALVFAHPMQRTPAYYAGLTLYQANDGRTDDSLVSLLSQTTAPFHLIHREAEFSLWTSSISGGSIKPIHIKSNIVYDELNSVLHNYSADLRPERIIEVKQGRSEFDNPIFLEVRPLQLSLFMLDVNRKLLIRYFSKAVEVLRETIGARGAQSHEELIPGGAIQLLSALILADTGVLEKLDQIEHYSLAELIHLASMRFPLYFKEQFFEEYLVESEEAYKLMRAIRYSGFSPDMLSDLYIAAYGQEQRKKWGRYDTPLHLTRRIWDNIPVEYLPSDQRVVADMTCGWGSFLVAAFERLERLNDMRDASFSTLLRGNDFDFFAAGLAASAMLISTSRDSWHIDHADAVDWPWLSRNAPNIIVGNPPFGGNRKTRYTAGGKRYQEADRFLLRAIERLAPGGYLAMILPQSFTVAQASPEVRKFLLENCDVLDIWDLPIGSFRDAAANTMVLFAQKKLVKDRVFPAPVRVRAVQERCLNEFERAGTFTSSSIVVDQRRWSHRSEGPPNSSNTHIINYTLILPEYMWQRILDRSLPLKDVATINMGAVVGQKTEKKRYKDVRNPKRVPWLSGGKKTIPREFFISYDEASTILYPNELVRPKLDLDQIFASPKVLLLSDPHPSWGKRAKVAIERRSHYVSNSFYILVPNPTSPYPHINNEVIAAVLGWCVGNAWILEHLRYPWIVKRTLEYLPFPLGLTGQDCLELTEAVHNLETSGSVGSPVWEEAGSVIDAVLQKAYQLHENTLERLRLVMHWDQSELSTLDPRPESSGARWRIHGEVESVDANENAITLWLDGIPGLQTVRIDPSMPGWMLRPGAAFRTTVPKDCALHNDLRKVVWGKFSPQPYTYLDEFKLLESLAKQRETSEYR